jgi:Ethanolamine utilization protein EutJ (predicted chaperonin)
MTIIHRGQLITSAPDEACHGGWMMRVLTHHMGLILEEAEVKTSKVKTQVII